MTSTNHFHRILAGLVVLAGLSLGATPTAEAGEPLPGDGPLSIQLRADVEDCVEPGARVTLELSIENRGLEEPLEQIEYRLRLPEGTRFLGTDLDAEYEEESHTLYGRMRSVDPGEAPGGLVKIEVDEDGFRPVLFFEADATAMGGEAAPPSSALLLVPICE